MSDARLSLEGGLSNVEIRADASLDRLLRGRFQGVRPAVDIDGSDVRVRSQHGGVDGLLRMFERRRNSSGEITLNASRIWELRIRGGASHVSADLRNTQVRSLEIVGGVEHVMVDLPHPSGAVRLRITGGVSDVRISRPAGVPVTVHARGGVNGLSIDAESFGPIGLSHRWQTPDFNPHAAHYALDVRGGVSDVSVESR
jgi:hypothetical protein